MSSEQTSLLALPYIAASQAQKHVTHNEALRRLDAIVHLSVRSATQISPPMAPNEGDRYIIPASATGAFANSIGKILAWQDGAWAVFQPVRGWIAYIEDKKELRAYDGTTWQSTGTTSARTDKLGINADADAINLLAVSSQATLLNHAGNGHQLKINKASVPDTASVLFQTGFSGRAEIGLAGNDALSIKVTADGANWRQAMTIDASTGITRFAQGTITPSTGQNLLINGDFQINQRSFAGGTLAAGVFGYDRWRAGNSGANFNVSALLATLRAGSLVQGIEPELFGETSFANQIFTVSLASLTGGNLTVRFGTASATLSPNAPSAVLTTGPFDTGALSFSLSLASASAVFSRLKLEPGSTATGWQARSRPTEIMLCQRYYETSVPTGQNPASYAPGPGGSSIYVSSDSAVGSVTLLRYLTPKRGVPIVTIRDGGANIGKISVYNGAWLNNFSFTGVLGATDKGFSLQQNNVGVYNVNFDYSAEAEI